MKCNIIGAGRLGKNIALALSKYQMISSLTVCNQNWKSAAHACKTIGHGVPVHSIDELPPADITWICSNDDTIPYVVEALNSMPLLKSSYIIHTSGALDSLILAPLKSKGCQIASFHPLKAFNLHNLNSEAFAAVDCVLEGDAVVCHWLEHTFTQLGAVLNTVTNKANYHAAACMTSNYLITLAAYSQNLLLESGLNETQSRRMLLNLMQSNLNNLHETEFFKDALTGPIARGDAATLKLHLEVITHPLVRQLYQCAGLATLELTTLSEKQKNSIALVLTEGFTGNIL